MKEIKEIKLKISELKTDFGNPKDITKKELENLKKSIVENGDFGIFVINEENQVLSGNQRVRAMLELGKGDESVSCKQLVGYSLDEQKRVLLEANANRGKYILDELEKFVAGTDLSIDDFCIHSTFSAREKAVQALRDVEVKEYPKVVVLNAEENAEFEELERELGVSGCLNVIRKAVKILKERKSNDK